MTAFFADTRVVLISFAALIVAIILMADWLVTRIQADHHRRMNGYAAWLFTTTYLPECPDVAAIESNLPQMPVRGERAL